jgi:uncharacterized protein
VIQLTPQRREFFRLYSRASANAVAISESLVRLLDEFGQRAADETLIREIREFEHEGDRVTRAVIDLLNRTFVTPFDRDDMYRLAGALDDICDHVDEAAGDITSFGTRTIRPKARQQADVILRCARKLNEAVDQLEGFKIEERNLIELRELENEGDRLARNAVAELFTSESDPIALIRWKSIYERLEEAVDACENAADVLEAIVVKNK